MRRIVLGSRLAGARAAVSGPSGADAEKNSRSSAEQRPDARGIPPARRAKTLLCGSWPARLAGNVLSAAVVGGFLTCGLSAAVPPDASATEVGAVPGSSGTVPARTYVNHRTPLGYEVLTVGPGDGYAQSITSHGITVEGTMSADPRGFTRFVESPGGVCPGQAGIYEASVDEAGLHLRAIDDPCRFRQSDFTSGPWKPYVERD